MQANVPMLARRDLPHGHDFHGPGWPRKRAISGTCKRAEMERNIKRAIRLAHFSVPNLLLARTPHNGTQMARFLAHTVWKGTS